LARLQFHIGTLAIVVLVLAIGFAALREANDVWDSSVFAATAGVLLTSVLLAIHRPLKKRAYWVGFALFGWAYLGLSLLPSLESRLITTKALAYLDAKLPRSIPPGFTFFDLDDDGLMDIHVSHYSQGGAFYHNTGDGTFEDITAVAGWNFPPTAVTGVDTRFFNYSPGPSPTGSLGREASFVRIGHSLLALIASLVGGQFSYRLYVKNRERAQGSARAVSST
jgi:hypothetical protein